MLMSSKITIYKNAFGLCKRLGIIICNNEDVVNQLDTYKQDYFGNEDVAVLSISNNEDIDSLIEDKIKQEIESIEDQEYKDNLSQVLGDLK